jgi:alkylhydroperoxidase family enzyme
LGSELVESILQDPRGADISPKLRAMLLFLEKMTLSPSELSHEDGRKLKEAGLGREEIRDALKVAFAFNLIDRLADSFEFAVPDQQEFEKGAKMIVKFGYKM